MSKMQNFVFRSLRLFTNLAFQFVLVFMKYFMKTLFLYHLNFLGVDDHKQIKKGKTRSLVPENAFYVSK